MNIQVIALINEKDFRLIDKSTGKINDIAYDNVKRVLVSKKASINGLGLDSSNNVIWTNGVSDRYTKIVNNIPVRNSKAAIILYKYDDSNEYIICTYDGRKITCEESEIIRMFNSKKLTIANGKVVTREDKTEFISAISGNFDYVHHAKKEELSNSTNAENDTKIKKEVDNKIKEVASSYEKAKKLSYAEYNKRKMINGGISTSEDYRNIKDKNNIITDKDGNIVVLTVDDKMTMAKNIIKKIRPFYYCILCSIDVRESSEIDTMGVSSSTLYFNANFVNRCTYKQIVFVLLHEVMHIALKHRLREGLRNHDTWNIATDLYINNIIENEFKLDYYNGNKEADFIQCPELICYFDNVKPITGLSAEIIYEALTEKEEEEQEQEPEEQESGDSNNSDSGDESEDKNDTDKSNSSDNSNEDNKSEEEKEETNYNGDGSSDSDESSNNNDSNNSDDSNGSSSEDNDNAGEEKDSNEMKNNNSSGDSDSDSEDNQNSNNESSSSSSSNDTESSESDNLDKDRDKENKGDKLENNVNSQRIKNMSKFTSEEQKKLKEDIKNSFKRPSDDELKKTEDLIDDETSAGKSEEAEEAIGRSILAKAITIAKMNSIKPGSDVESAFFRNIEASMAQEINWRSVLQNKLVKSKQRITSLATPDKRFRSRGKILPGIRPGDNDMLDMVRVYIDTSGSISDKDLGEMYIQIGNLVKKYNTDLELAFWDTRVRAVYNYKNVKRVNDFIEAKPVGGGGTDANCVFKYITEADKKKHRRGYEDIILIFTDGYIGEVSKEYKKYRNVIWIINGDYKGFKEPFGIKAKFKTNK